jgi:F-type H+-transporting ATPase subunit gamma
MANTTTLKRRIGSVKNTRQITKAMELVAASKMRRAQEQAISSRDFRIQAHDILERLSGVSDVQRHPLFVKRTLKNRLVIVITSDTGLAGAYDANVLKRLTSILKEDQDNKADTHVITIGKKGAQFVSRLDTVALLAAFPIFSTHPKPAEIRPIVNTLFELYSEEKVDAVTIVYTNFVSSIRQEVQALQLLPAQPPEIDKNKISPLEVAIFEPSIESIVESVVARLIEVQVWQATLESLASEHSSRMLAMKNASDNASDIIDDLTLEFNTARQADITQQIAEIVGGAEAMTS